MGLLIIACNLIFIILNLFNEKSFKRTITIIFHIWWLFIVSISLINTDRLNVVSDKVYFFVFLHILTFSIGLNLNVKFNYRSSNRRAKTIAELVENNSILGVLSVLLIPIAFYAIRFIELTSTYEGVKNGRLLRYSVGELFKTSMEIHLFNFFGELLFIFAAAVCFYCLLYNPKKIALIAISLGVVLLYASIGMGRFEFFEICCIFATVFLFKYYTSDEKSGVKNKIGLKHILLLVIIALGAVFLFLYTTASRLVTTLSLSNFKEILDISLEQVRVYTTGSFRAFDYALENYREELGMNYGRMTFGGFDEIFGLVLGVLGFNYPIMNYTYGELIREPISIGGGSSFNALYTGLFHFYFDFGIIGIIVFSFLFGLLINYFIGRLMEKRYFLDLLMVGILLNQMFMMSMRWALSSTGSVIVIIMVLMFGKQIKIEDKKQLVLNEA